MIETEPNYPIRNSPPLEVDYGKILKIILSRWYWVMASILISAGFAYLHLRYTPPRFAAEATLRFDEKKSEIAELISVRNLYDRTNKAESEKSVIRSRAVLLTAMRSMHYEISWYKKGKLKTTDIYPEKPFPILIIKKSVDRIIDGTFELVCLNKKEFILSFTQYSIYRSLRCSYGQTILLPNIQFVIYPAQHLPIAKSSYNFKFNEAADFVERINNTLKIDNNQNLNVLNLKITDVNPYFAADALNAILDEYLKFDKIQRSAAATQTTNFIDTLLENMTSLVNTSGKAIEVFKATNQMVDISSASDNILSKLSELEVERYNLEVQSISIQQLEKSLLQPDAPNASLQGITDPQLNSLLLKFNELLFKRSAYLEIYQQKSPFILRVDENIKEFRKAMIANVATQRRKNDKMFAFIKHQINTIKENLQVLPAKERNYIDLQSRFNINQKVYGYLSEKKLESQIAKASVISGASIIDRAVYSKTPVSPLTANTYTLFILGGFGSGICFIFGVRMLNPFLYDREAIENLTNIPILGIVRKYTGQRSQQPLQIFAIEDPRSLFSESIRAIRTNLNFFAPEKECRVICITSEISGEGKSFISANLAGSLSLLEKKVILISADLRKSSRQYGHSRTVTKGLSNYLSGQGSLEDILCTTHLKNLTFVPSGHLPPNPSELLHSKRMQEMISTLKDMYDFIVVDSAPVGLVSDGIPLLKIADINLFVLRYGVSRNYSAILPQKLSREFNLPNTAIVLNAFEHNNLYSPYYSNKQNPSNNNYYAHYYST